jgi:hypothetical protein
MSLPTRPQKVQACSRQTRPLTRLTLLGMAVNGAGRVVRAVSHVLPLEPRRLWRQAFSPYPQYCVPLGGVNPCRAPARRDPAPATPPHGHQRSFPIGRTSTATNSDSDHTPAAQPPDSTAPANRTRNPAVRGQTREPGCSAPATPRRSEERCSASPTASSRCTPRAASTSTPPTQACTSRTYTRTCVPRRTPAASAGRA